jgi:hypothetical protein
MGLASLALAVELKWPRLPDLASRSTWQFCQSRWRRHLGKALVDNGIADEP